jgi:hypothetical protein
MALDGGQLILPYSDLGRQRNSPDTHVRLTSFSVINVMSHGACGCHPVRRTTLPPPVNNFEITLGSRTSEYLYTVPVE